MRRPAKSIDSPPTHPPKLKSWKASLNLNQQPKFPIGEAAAMANSSGSNIIYTLRKAVVICSLFAVVAVADVGGERHCPPSSCGHLRNISYPFRLRGDPRQCVATPRPWYDLSCSSSGKATIQINTRKYYVSSINYTAEDFLAIDATMLDDDVTSSCSIPPADNHPPYIDWPPDWWMISTDSYGFINLQTAWENVWACFVNCSKPIISDTAMLRYRPIACLPANNSFVYLNMDGGCIVGELQPSCRYLAMIPFDGRHISYYSLRSASYTDIVGYIRKGFRVRFPYHLSFQRGMSTTQCLNDSVT